MGTVNRASKLPRRDAREALQAHGDMQRRRLAAEDVGEVRLGDPDLTSEGDLGRIVSLQIGPDLLFDRGGFLGHGANLRTTRNFMSSESSGHPNLFSGLINGPLKPHDTSAQLASFLREALRQRGAKAALSHQCKVAAATVTDWANGKYSPSVSQLGKIADALGVTVADFFAPSEKNSDLSRQTVGVDSALINRAEGANVSSSPSRRDQDLRAIRAEVSSLSVQLARLDQAVARAEADAGLDSLHHTATTNPEPVASGPHRIHRQKRAGAR